jgi:hypothetical protein
VGEASATGFRLAFSGYFQQKLVSGSGIGPWPSDAWGVVCPEAQRRHSMHRKTLWRMLGGLVLTLALAVPALAADYEVPVVTGEHWTKSTPQERKAFLVGAATIIELEQEVQGDTPPKKTTIDVWCKGLSPYTIDQMITAIDAWYATNPDKLARPVVEVMWFELAKPKTGKS